MAERPAPHATLTAAPRSMTPPRRHSQPHQSLARCYACALLQLNDRLSLGQHRVWKRMAVKWAGAAPGQRALDVCCGSGDLAMLLAAAVGQSGSVTGLDFAAAMLQVRRRQLAGCRGDGIMAWRALLVVV
jgi:demethylmenaquinone methyltransferase/2-methoxy-6-polyprenyl-1,4-benzoquinol methylase